MAATVLRDVPRLSTGSEVVHGLRIMWPDGRQWLTGLDQLPEDEVWQAAVFDAAVAHADHGGNNWFGVPDPSTGARAHLRLVDTGNAFDLGGNSVNSSFYQHHLDDPLPEHVLEAVQRLYENWPSVLVQLLGQDEADRTRERARQLAEEHVLRIG
ncbi:MAG: hypothetical protein ACLP0L_13735 [Solirubrobacteraceae bacterium]